VKILIVDNGSLEPAAVLALREVAARVSEKVGRPIFPVSLAHSDKVPAAGLGGEAAQCVEAFLREQLERGERDFVILPFFIGPSRAVTHALPNLVEKLRGEFPDLRVRIAPVLHAAGDDTLARILADRVRGALGKLWKVDEAGLNGETETETRVRVALVDHGSPLPDVTAVRDEVAHQLAALLSGDTRISEVAACSMERRPGAAYAFNEPLLETLLAREDWRAGAAAQSLIIVAQLFLLPGRHAGPGGNWCVSAGGDRCASAGGDIAQICARAKEHSPSLQTVQTEPLATHPLLVELLTQRLGAVLPAFSVWHAAYVNAGCDSTLEVFNWSRAVNL